MSTFPPIAQLVPHAAPMLLLDGLVAHDGERAVCTVTVRDGRPFVEDHRVPTVVTLEYMAQTVAAYAGYEGYQIGGPVEIAFLIGCRRMRSHQPYVPVGSTLTIEAHHVWGDNALGTFACTATLADGTPVAEATLSVFQPGSSDGNPLKS